MYRLPEVGKFDLEGKVELRVTLVLRADETTMRPCATKYFVLTLPLFSNGRRVSLLEPNYCELISSQLSSPLNTVTFLANAFPIMAHPSSRYLWADNRCNMYMLSCMSLTYYWAVVYPDFLDKQVT